LTHPQGNGSSTISACEEHFHGDEASNSSPRAVCVGGAVSAELGREAGFGLGDAASVSPSASVAGQGGKHSGEPTDENTYVDAFSASEVLTAKPGKQAQLGVRCVETTQKTRLQLLWLALLSVLVRKAKAA
jgi:hypothetical protein